MSSVRAAVVAPLCLLAGLAGCPEPLPGEPGRLTFELEGAHAEADCISCHGPNDNWGRCLDYEGEAIACSPTCEDCHERPAGHNVGQQAVGSCNDGGCHQNPDNWLPLQPEATAGQ